ncbi:hypothetical protein C8F01DRAFT_1369993 [Mycena amicta]|nr:hypothetical protein C8F01DRAFT_1369993 [Mycena amicta]
MPTTIPPEIVNRIAANIPSTRLPTLCRVSRSFRAEVERVLYHTIDLSTKYNRRRLKSLFLVLGRHEYLCLLVRAVFLSAGSSRGFLPEDQDELSRILKRCAKLRALSIHRLSEFPLLDVHPGDLNQLRAYETSVDTLDLPVVPPVQLLQLHLSTFKEEDIAIVKHALPLYAGTLETLNVIMDGIYGIGLAFLFDHLAAALPNLRQLRVCPPSGTHAAPNLNGGPYDGESFNPILSALAKFTALDSLVFHLRSELNLEFYVLPPSAPERSYHLGYPEDLGWDADEDKDDSDSDKDEDEDDEDTRIPRNERDFGCEIMLACPTLRRLELGIETYSRSPTYLDGPASYIFTRTEGGTVDAESYRQKNWGDWGWTAKEDFAAWI